MPEGQSNCPERETCPDFRFVLCNERQEKLTLPFCTGNDCHSPIWFAC